MCWGGIVLFVPFPNSLKNPSPSPGDLEFWELTAKKRKCLANLAK